MDSGGPCNYDVFGDQPDYTIRHHPKVARHPTYLKHGTRTGEFVDPVENGVPLPQMKKRDQYSLGVRGVEGHRCRQN
jgi:hypothetical protein